MERGETRVDEWVISSYSEMSIPELISLLGAQLAKLPLERHAEKVVRVEDDSLRVAYTRPETDEEMAERITRTAKYAAEREARDRADFARLKQKYEP